MKKTKQKWWYSNRFLALGAATLFLLGFMILWVASLHIPSLETLADSHIDSSTKIYDRTGEILLYDFSPDVKRETVPFDQISPFVKEATIAIEDKNFYQHHGFELTSLLRAVLTDVATISFSQGGSTITQQVVKNTILTNDKTPTRKLKELILAIKLEKVLSKDQILALYLNEIPYGGTVYGVQQAAEHFFGKSASDLTLAESAYIAAVPQAPTHYSPYGDHVDELETRKNLVLKEMLNQKYITEDQYNQALNEKVTFKSNNTDTTIKAPHFVFFVIDQLTQKYGEDALRNSGWKIVTTLDYSIQKDAEAIAKKYGEINQKSFNANNNAMVVIDPKTGEILAMTGSRDYFDKAINGNFNAATSHRQPGSTFKPFVYSVLFNKGYTDQTILWDAQTQFSTNCAPDNFTTDDKCYAPGNFDDKFRGPMTIRAALAESINIPAVKALYIAGVKNAVSLAQSMGVNFVGDTSQYGLSLVLGGGSVSLLDMASAYSVFANDGVRNPYTPIISVQDDQGNIIDKENLLPQRVLPEQTVRMMNDILSDDNARAAEYGLHSTLDAGPNVAVKTGTSNDYRDAWIIGYSPDIVVGAWVGNNDNSPMEKKIAGLIVSPMWREMIDKILPTIPSDQFIQPEPNPTDLKPVLLGQVMGAHSILYYVNKDDPRGSGNSMSDPQFNNWEYGIRRYVETSGYGLPQAAPASPQTQTMTPTTQTTQPAGMPGFVPEPGF